MTFKGELTMFNAALFRIEQSSTQKVADMIKNGLSRGEINYPGMLDANLFTG